MGDDRLRYVECREARGLKGGRSGAPQVRGIISFHPSYDRDGKGKKALKNCRPGQKCLDSDSGGWVTAWGKRFKHSSNNASGKGSKGKKKKNIHIGGGMLATKNLLKGEYSQGNVDWGPEVEIAEEKTAMVEGISERLKVGGTK